MTDEELARSIDNLIALADGDVKQLRVELQKHVLDVEARLNGDIAELLSAHGKVRCQACDGYGAFRRLDASVMRRFGLQDWTGCEACGGDNKRMGRRFVDRRGE